MSDESKIQEIDFAGPVTSIKMIRAAGYHRWGGSGGWYGLERQRPDGSLERVSAPLWLRQFALREFELGMKEAQRRMRSAMGAKEES